jgi:hypothetical protein
VLGLAYGSQAKRLIRPQRVETASMVRPVTVALKEVALAACLSKRFAPVVFRPVEDEGPQHEVTIVRPHGNLS